MADEDRTREELLREIRELKGQLAGTERPLEEGSGSGLEAHHRAVTSDQRLISRYRPDGTLTFVSDAFCRYFGREREALIGRSLLAVLHEADRQLFRGHMASLGRAKPIGLVEHRVIRGDGEERWHVRVDHVFLDAQGEVVEVDSVARDITDQRRVTVSLRQREATIRAVFESATEGILGVDRAGRIVLANPRIEAMFGYEPGELLGESVEALVPERARRLHARHRDGFFAEPRTRSMGLGMTLTGRRRDGVEFPIEVSLSFIDDDSGGVAMAFVTDISERIAQERQARHVEKLVALGTLAAGIAHEINNPIGIILSRIELMLMDAGEQGLGSQGVTDLETLHRQAARLGRIAQGLLSFGRQHRRERQLVDLSAIVEDTLLLTSKQLARDGIHVVTALNPALPRISADATALEQVLMNLILNARDAMPGGGSLRIETGPATDTPAAACLVVTDSGAGMTAEVAARLAEPFFTSKPGGTGLGLSVSYRIVREHGGTVDVASVPGRGTTFRITFPIEPEPPNSA